MQAIDAEREQARARTRPSALLAYAVEPCMYNPQGFGPGDADVEEVPPRPGEDPAREPAYCRREDVVAWLRLIAAAEDPAAEVWAALEYLEGRRKVMMTARKVALDEALSDLETLAGLVDRLARERGEARRELEILKNGVKVQRRDFQHQLSQALHESGVWQLEAGRLKGVALGHEKDIVRHRAQVTELRATLAGLHRERDNLAQRVMVTKADNEAVWRENAALREANFRLTGDLLTMMAQRDEARGKARNLAAVCAGQQTALENQRERRRELERENRKLRNKLDAAIAERGELIVDSKRLAERVDRLRRLLAKEDARRHGHLIPEPHPETTPPPPRDITRYPDDLEPGGFKCPWCGEPRWYVRGKWRHGEAARRAMHEMNDSWHRRDGSPALACDGHILRYLYLPPLPWRWESNLGSFWKAPISFEDQGRFFRREDSESAAALEEQRATWHQRLVGWLTLAPEVDHG